MTDQVDSPPAGNCPAETPLQPIAPWQTRRVRLPVLLFVATCLSTWISGGLIFSLALMTTLFAHEMGHYLQARRYGVPASLPYFIPMPLSPIGTMGAVIVMQPGRGNRRTLFDIAVSGPLARLTHPRCCRAGRSCCAKADMHRGRETARQTMPGFLTRCEPVPRQSGVDRGPGT
jgi:hypothetical protein